MTNEGESDMTYENILYEVDDRIAVVTLNRPEKRNALSWPLLADLSAALKQAEKDKDVRVIILKGAGPCFSAGHDLSDSMGDAPLHYGSKSWDETLQSEGGVGVGVSVWDSRAHVRDTSTISLRSGITGSRLSLKYTVTASAGLQVSPWRVTCLSFQRMPGWDIRRQEEWPPATKL